MALSQDYPTGWSRRSAEVLDASYNLLANSLSVTQATSITKAYDSITTYPYGTSYVQLSASALVFTGQCKLVDIFVSAASATPTIKVWDNTSAATTILIDVFTPVAGTTYTFNNKRSATGIFVTISGTVSCTVGYDAVSM
jgi:hypothetical protein